MPVIRHPKTAFAGSLVVGARRYEFENGTAHSDINERDRVYLTVYGFTIADEPEEFDGELVETEEDPEYGEQLGGLEYTPDAAEIPEP
ncbi:hypothetical protein [Gordonia sp. (in: high G+C Gram-positive bacteria)]|uniref:hypothetical protein n=1 Tax=Gordonia sp. (in: high G+C Gram-positive bacteria) TaxID=84139 RepID=UPI003C792328